MQFFNRLTAVAAAVLTLAFAAPVPSESELVPGKYIVQLKPNVDVATIAAHHEKVRKIHAENVAKRDVFEGESAGIEQDFGFGDFHGYAGGFDENTVEELKKMPEVLNVEQDTIMTTLALTTRKRHRTK